MAVGGRPRGVNTRGRKAGYGRNDQLKLKD
jgi:hypothetical protein